MTISHKCFMCDQNNELQDSHIIPRSYFKGLKGASGQLFTVSTDETVGVKLSNSDPKEPLFCLSCEQYLSENFEVYGTRLLKDRKKVKRSINVVVFENFRFKQFYLYLISIIWRASISKLARYSHVELGPQIENLLRHCLKENKIKIQTSLRLDHFIKISLIRISDETGQLSDEIIRKVMVDLSFEVSASKEDGFIYYFMVDGFLIVYHFSAEDDIHSVRTRKNYAQIRNVSRLLVPILDVNNFKQLAYGFASVTKQAAKYRDQ